MSTIHLTYSAAIAAEVIAPIVARGALVADFDLGIIASCALVYDSRNGVEGWRIDMDADELAALTERRRMSTLSLFERMIAADDALDLAQEERADLSAAARNAALTDAEALAADAALIASGERVLAALDVVHQLRQAARA